MKQPLCITTFVSNEQYHEFVPLYIYFILKAYGDQCFPVIYVHEHLSEHHQRQLERIKDIGEFAVHEGYMQETRLGKQECRCIRWFLYDSCFDDFQAVYIGDIDILIMPEDPPLWEQHLAHCEILGLPYSNVVRPILSNKLGKGWQSLGDIITTVGLAKGTQFLLSPRTGFHRLSGLHFVQPSLYFPRVRPWFPKYRDITLDNSLQSRRRSIHHVNGFNNECLLYDMIRESGIGTPPPGPLIVDYRRYREAHFCPHHGLHIRVFMTDALVQGNQRLIHSDCYREYYHQFTKTIHQDPLAQELINQVSPRLLETFQRMKTCYEH